MGKRCLFASLIDINAYKQNALGGCIKDVLAIDLLLSDQCNQQGKDQLRYKPKYFLAPTDSDKKRIAAYAKEQKLRKFSASLPTFKNISGERLFDDQIRKRYHMRLQEHQYPNQRRQDNAMKKNIA